MLRFGSKDTIILNQLVRIYSWIAVPNKVLVHLYANVSKFHIIWKNWHIAVVIFLGSVFNFTTCIIKYKIIINSDKEPSCNIK